MKIFSLIFPSILFSSYIFAQAPNKMSYQAVIRDGVNALLVNHVGGMQISILQGNINGSVVYLEIQTPSTNTNGLVSLEIGNGIPINGDFSNIDWSNGPYYIKTETDLSGGTNYTLTGVSELLSVPNALYAKSAGNNTPGPQGPNGFLMFASAFEKIVALY
jgi:hypothetical protein